MPRLSWQQENRGTQGIDRVVLFVGHQPGTAWSGVTAIEVDDSATSFEPLHQDGEVYRYKEKRSVTRGRLRAFASPKEFDVCEGIQTTERGLSFHGQRRKAFHLSYRTMLRSNRTGLSHYKLSFLYNVLATPASAWVYQTLANDSSLTEFDWDLAIKPNFVTGKRSVTQITIDSTEMPPSILAQIEDVLYGSSSQESFMPSIEQLEEICAQFDELIIHDLGDGIYQITSEASALTALSESLYEVTSDQIRIVDSETYEVDVDT